MNEDCLAPQDSGVLSLPEEVLLIIGQYLHPRDLLAVSGVCRYLRSVFNVNSLWEKYTEGGCISRGLDSVVSLVKPELDIPCEETLKPLCEHRLHFLKQSRLLSNIRQGNDVDHSIRFRGGFLSEIDSAEARSFSYLNPNRQITYASKYLFTMVTEDNLPAIRIFDIEISPKPLMTIKFENHSAGSFDVRWLQVVKDQLVVRKDDWIDIYKIELPELLKITQSINVVTSRNRRINQVLVIGGFLFVENFGLNTVHVWNISTGNQCDDLTPKVSGPDFMILGYSQNEKLILLSVGMLSEGNAPFLFVYDIDTQDFSSFCPILNGRNFRNGPECYGLIDSNYVVLLQEQSFHIFVFDYKSSSLFVKKKRGVLSSRFKDVKIIGEYLVVPSFTASVFIMDITTLNTVWEIQLDLDSIEPESPWIRNREYCEMLGIEVLHVSTLCSLLVIHKMSGIELWDFYRREKICTFWSHGPDKGNAILNDTCSKLIVFNFFFLTVISFW